MKRIYVSVFRIDRIEGRSAYGACYGLLLAKGDGPKYISVIATTKIPSQESLCGICLYFRQQGTADESAEQNRRGIAGEGYLEIVHGRKDKRKWSKQLAAVDKNSNYAGVLCVDSRVLLFDHGRMNLCGFSRGLGEPGGKSGRINAWWGKSKQEQQFC